MTPIRYPVTEPHLDATDRESLMNAFDSGWISSQGPCLGQFEQTFAKFAGVNYALATCNGTVALHLALLALNVQPGDEVLVPTFTYIASANAIRYCGATPVLVDCTDDTWNIDPLALEAAITPRTVGIMPVHLYGQPCDMRAIQKIATEHGLWIVEDAAEAHGATVENEPVGSTGTIGTFSLFGNKIITTGEGGVVTTNDATLAERMSLFRGQGMDPQRRYWFPMVGYNYRMTNLAAALGVSQLAKADTLIAAHRRVYAWYRDYLGNLPMLAWQAQPAGTESVQWLTSIRLIPAENHEELRDALMTKLRADGIDTRPFFYPMHVMPPYHTTSPFPVADRIATSGLNLPSSPLLREHDVAWIASRVRLHVHALLAGNVFATPTVRAPHNTTSLSVETAA